MLSRLITHVSRCIGVHKRYRNRRKQPLYATVAQGWVSSRFALSNQLVGFLVLQGIRSRCTGSNERFLEADFARTVSGILHEHYQRNAEAGLQVHSSSLPATFIGIVAVCVIVMCVAVAAWLGRSLRNFRALTCGGHVWTWPRLSAWLSLTVF